MVSRSLFPHHCGMEDFMRFLSISRIVPIFTKLSEMTDADKIMNPHHLQHSGSDAANIRIRINPKIWIRILDHFWLTFRPWRSLLSPSTSCYPFVVIVRPVWPTQSGGGVGWLYSNERLSKMVYAHARRYWSIDIDWQVVYDWTEDWQVVARVTYSWVAVCGLRDWQVVEDGYEFFAKRQLVTLFSAPNYCGEFDNAGAMMSVDETLMCSFQVTW